MSDQIVTNAQTEPVKEQPQAAAPATTGGKTFTEAEVEQLIKDRLTRESAKKEKAIQEATAKAAEETAKKSGEWEKVAQAKEQELLRLQTELKSRELHDLKRNVAEKVGLPAALAARLMGETEADLEKDAKALLDTLPKQPKPTAGPIPNPGASGQVAETDAQKRARLFGARQDIFDTGFVETHGGGVFQTEK
jgi:hypothetical protein